MMIIWILLLIVLTIYELMTMNLIAIFYVGGISLSLLLVNTTSIPNNYILELVLSFVFGTVLLYFFKDKLKKYLRKKNIIKK